MSKEVHWAQFFKEAGLPASIAKNYSITFEENRISKDMLLDLNQDILVSMGITAMGDVINILKHAKKAHSQEAKRKDAVHTTKTMLVSNKRPPPPAAHSTTAKQAPAVSTTSSATKKKIVRKYPRHEVVPDSPSPELPAHPAHSARQTHPQTHPARRGERREAEQDVTYLVLDPGHRVRPQQRDQQEEEEEYIIEESTEPLELAPAEVAPVAANDSFESIPYEARRPKRPMRMYSDEMEAVPQPKQPRVIILPGERQDIFTTSGLQKAAKVYESGGEPEGKLTSDRSRRLLESAGLIPSQDKTASNSVFSRLDYKPSVPSHLTSPPTSHPLTHPAAGISAKAPPTSSTITKTSRRIIKLTKRPSGSSSSRSVSSPSAKPERSVSSTVSPIRRITTESNTISVTSKPTRAKASSSSSGVLVRRLISKAEESRAVLGKEGVRRRAVSNPVPRGMKRQFSSEHVSFRSSSTSSSSSGGGGGGGREKRSSIKFSKSTSKRSGVFSYDSDAIASPSTSSTMTLHHRENRSHRLGTRSKVKVKAQPSMVADEYEYQTQRQHDIRSRLEVRELAKRARRGGPLKGRLASHQVFHRLE